MPSPAHRMNSRASETSVAGHAMRPEPLASRCRSTVQTLAAFDSNVGEVHQPVTVLLDTASLAPIKSLRPSPEVRSLWSTKAMHSAIDHQKRILFSRRGSIGVEKQPERFDHQLIIHRRPAGTTKLSIGLRLARSGLHPYGVTRRERSRENNSIQAKFMQSR